MNPQYLYIVLLGGKHEKANIEIHDVIPVVAQDLKQASPYLKQQWFGLQKGLHIDGWMQINGVDYQDETYQVVISDQHIEKSDLKLFLINLGAYLPTEFGEIHKYLVVAGMNKADAKVQGKRAIEKHWFKPHTDAVVEIDDCIDLSSIHGQKISLKKGEFETNPFVNDYILI